MRITLLTAILFLLTSSLYAQLQRGDRLLGISNGFEFSTGFTPRVVEDQLGGIYAFTEGDGVALFASPTVHFALGNRFTLGGSVAMLLLSDEGSAFVLSPAVRYYPINREQFRLYASVLTNALFDGDNIYGGDGLAIGGGLQLPIAAGVLLTTALNYNFNSVRHVGAVQAGIEITLGRNTRPAEKPVASFTKGSLMFGSQTLGVEFSRRTSGFNLRPGLHYFLTDRLALGVSAGITRATVDFIFSGNTERFSATQAGVNTGLRYYFTTASRLVWFAEAGIGYRHFSQRNNRNGDVDFGTVTLSGGAGGQLFLRDNFALEFGPSLLVNTDESETRIGLTLGARFVL